MFSPQGAAIGALMVAAVVVVAAVLYSTMLLLIVLSEVLMEKSGFYVFLLWLFVLMILGGLIGGFSQ